MGSSCHTICHYWTKERDSSSQKKILKQYYLHELTIHETASWIPMRSTLRWTKLDINHSRSCVFLTQSFITWCFVVETTCDDYIWQWRGSDDKNTLLLNPAHYTTYNYYMTDSLSGEQFELYIYMYGSKNFPYKVPILRQCNISVFCTVFNQSGADYHFYKGIPIFLRKWRPGLHILEKWGPSPHITERMGTQSPYYRENGDPESPYYWEKGDPESSFSQEYGEPFVKMGTPVWLTDSPGVWGPSVWQTIITGSLGENRNPLCSWPFSKSTGIPCIPDLQ